MPERVAIIVEVNLDPMPGTFHTLENAKQSIEKILNDRIPHYNPVVLLKEN